MSCRPPWSSAGRQVAVQAAGDLILSALDRNDLLDALAARIGAPGESALPPVITLSEAARLLRRRPDRAKAWLRAQGLLVDVAGEPRVLRAALEAAMQARRPERRDAPATPRRKSRGEAETLFVLAPLRQPPRSATTLSRALAGRTPSASLRAASACSSRDASS